MERKSAIATVFVLLTLSLCSCGVIMEGVKAESAAKNFYTAFLKGDIKRAAGFASEDTGRLLYWLDEKAKESGITLKQLITDGYGEKKVQVKIIESRIEGDSAVVTIELDGNKHEVSLVRDDNAWKVNFGTDDL